VCWIQEFNIKLLDDSLCLNKALKVVRVVLIKSRFGTNYRVSCEQRVSVCDHSIHFSCFLHQETQMVAQVTWGVDGLQLNGYFIKIVEGMNFTFFSMDQVLLKLWESLNSVFFNVVVVPKLADLGYWCI
jgi:hypothetical protein